MVVRGARCVRLVHQIGEAYTFTAVCLLLVRSARASLRVIADFHRLHSRCMSRQLDRSVGEPPRERGMSSSTSARMGWGTHPGHVPPGHRGPWPPGVLVRVLSTRSSQRAQVFSSASTRLRSSRRRWPFALCIGEGIFTPTGIVRAMTDSLDDLHAVTAKLRAHDERRANLLHSRDALVRQALAEGATWAMVQQVTGLTPRGVALAIQRERR